MIESITAITIAILLLAYFRPGKTPPLENPLTISRLGKYIITLAPKLNLAQPFVEEVAKRIMMSIADDEGCAIRYFIVRDNQVRAHGGDLYLLSIGYNNKMLYFYAANPYPNSQNDYLNAIKAYSIDCMNGFPEANIHREPLESIIVSAVQAVANENGIEVSNLTE